MFEPSAIGQMVIVVTCVRLSVRSSVCLSVTPTVGTVPQPMARADVTCVYFKRNLHNVIYCENFMFEPSAVGQMTIAVTCVRLSVRPSVTPKVGTVPQPMARADVARVYCFLFP